MRMVAQRCPLPRQREGALCSQPAERVWFEAEEVLADRFEMLLPALQLL